MDFYLFQPSAKLDMKSSVSRRGAAACERPQYRCS